MAHNELVTKNYCEKCQQCTSQAIDNLVGVIEEKFKGLKQNFVVASAVLVVVISVIDILARFI